MRVKTPRKNRKTQNFNILLTLTLLETLFWAHINELEISIKFCYFGHLLFFFQNIFGSCSRIIYFSELRSNLRKTTNIFKHFAKSKNFIFLPKYLPFYIWFPFSFKHWRSLLYSIFMRSFSKKVCSFWLYIVQFLPERTVPNKYGDCSRIERRTGKDERGQWIWKYLNKFPPENLK